jgi:hypothetical protein
VTGKETVKVPPAAFNAEAWSRTDAGATFQRVVREEIPGAGEAVAARRRRSDHAAGELQAN